MKDIKFLKENNVDVDKSIELFGDMEMYNETMQDFLDSIHNKLDKLDNFKNLNEPANYAIFAHSIKSDARYLGFTSIAEVALKHEMAGKENNGKFINDDYDNLLNNVKEMIDIVTRYLTEEPDAVTVVTNDKNEVLAIDDSELITNLICKTLKDEYKVLPFNDAKSAIEYINSNKDKIKVILLDLNMPEVNGFQVLEYLKQQNLFNDIKVSIITGDESEDTIKSAFNYPIVDVLNKPFGVETLKNITEKTFNE